MIKSAETSSECLFVSNVCVVFDVLGACGARCAVCCCPLLSHRFHVHYKHVALLGVGHVLGIYYKNVISVIDYVGLKLLCGDCDKNSNSLLNH